jgi:RNA polymerase sigma-70 factor, ECF subfamily
MCNSEVSDKSLVKQYIDGNEVAFEMLLKRHKSSVFHYILSKLKDRDLSDDIFQDTFIKVIRTLKAGNYNEEGKFLPWVLRIAHNLVIDHFRRTNKVRIVSESSSFSEDYTIFNILASEDLNVEQAQSKAELESQVVNLMHLLPESQKEILQMRLFQEMSFKDISEAKDISINTALGRMRYALINLRKIIDEYGVVVEY